MKTNKTLSIIIAMFISIFILLGSTNKPVLADDTTPPTVVSITGDTSGTTGETVTLEAVVEDDVGVTEVVFNIGTPVATTTAATRVLQVQGVQGTYRVVVRIPSNSTDDIPYYVEASDAAGNTARAPEEGTYTITVTDNDAPTIVLTQPNGGETWNIGMRYDITWTAEDNIDVTSIDISYSTDNGSSWENIAVGENNDGVYRWQITSPPSTKCLVKILAHDEAGNSKEDVSDSVFTIELFGRYPFFDDMEDIDSGNWNLEPPWDYTTEYFHSGDYSLTDSPGGNYGNNVNISATLFSGINLTNAEMPVLRFWHQYSLETNKDYGYVDVSGDGGSSWKTLYFVTGHSGGWLEEAIDLSVYAYLPDVRIRFRLKSNDNTTFDGWYIDDVSIDETATPTLSFPFFDDMEDEEATKANWLSSSWELLDTDGHSGTHCWTDNPMGNYVQHTYSTLTLSGTLDLSTSTHPQLTFWYKGCVRYYPYVQISTDSGHTYTTIWNPYEFNQSAWTQIQLDLSSYRSPRTRLRFVIDSQSSAYDGWYIDDVYIDEPPPDVELFPPENVTMRGADLSWSQDTNDDFHHYEIYRSTSSNVSRSDTLVAQIENQAQTTYSDSYTILQPNYYWYRVYVVVNKGGMYSLGSNPQQAIYHVPKVSYPFFDDMESGTDNWEWNTPWELTDFKSHSEQTSWTDSPDGNYYDNANTALTTAIDFRDAEMPVLRFWHQYSLETNKDYGYVDVSGDGGSSWKTLYFVTGHSGGWLEEAIDLSVYAYLPDVRIRFRLKSNDNTTFDGWYIDDVSIDETATPTLSFPFFDDMEDEEATKANWLSSSWELLDTDGHSGTHCWTDNPMGNYVQHTYSTLTLSGTLDLSTSTHPQLTFWYKGCVRYYPYVQISTDSGHTYTTIWNPYEFNQSAWTQIQLDLSSYRSPRTRLRFVIDSQSSAYDGWYIDDVYIGEPPSTMVDWCSLDSPASVSTDKGVPTENIYGLVYEPGITEPEGQGAGIIAKLGYGPNGSLPWIDENWEWFDAAYDSDVDDKDKYVATLTVDTPGTYDYAYRYQLVGNSTWVYADLDGNDFGSETSNGYSPSQAGDLTVLGEVTPPVITSISPSIGPVGTQVTITGEHFGVQQDGSTVTFNGVDAGVADSWSDTTIKIKVPEGATTGPVVVTVSGQASNDDKIFTVGDEPHCAFADVDGDCDVDIVDIQKVAGRWGAKCGDDDYVPEYDVDGDCDIDIVDIQKVAGCWGTVLPCATGAIVINQPDLSSDSPVQVSIQPQLQKFTLSETAMIEVKIENASNVGAFEFTLGYDSSVVQVKKVEGSDIPQIVESDVILGDFLGSTGRMIAIAGSNIDNERGAFSYGAYSYGEDDGPSGEGILVQIPLKAVGEGHTALELTAVQVTDADGNLIPVSTVNGSVTTTPDYGDVSGNGEVTAYDAALVLQRVVGLIAPDDENFPYLTLATADVTGDGTISALDAAFILKYSVNLIDRFPVQEQSGSPMHNPLVTAAKVSVADVSAKPGNRVIVPIKLEHARDALALQFTVNYDARILRFIRVAFSTLTENSKESAASVTSNNAPDGTLNVALATATDMVETGEIIHLEFDVLMTPAGYASPLELVDVYLNESMTPQVKHGSVKILPNRTALLQNYPNPFNPETWIPYQLSQSAEVSIEIYSISGRLVRHLELGRKGAGFYTSRSDAAYWDGRNQLWEKVSSGVYFYHLKAGDFQATRKLLVTK